MPDLFLQSRLSALRDEGRLRANESVLVPLSLKMKMKLMEWVLLTIIHEREIEPVSALLVFARANEID